MRIRIAAAFLALTTVYGSVSRSVAESDGAIGWVVLAGPDSFLLSDCVVLRIAVYDWEGAAAPPVSDIPAVLGDLSPARGAFFSDPSCLVPLASDPLISGGTAYVDVYYKNSQQGPINVQIGAVEGYHVVGWESNAALGNPAYLAMDWPTPSQPAAICSGPFHLQARDEQGNAVIFDRRSNHDLALTYELGDARFYSDPACTVGNELNLLTLPAGAAVTGGFYFQGTTESHILVQPDVEGYENHIGWNPASETIM